jgi:hypothetical protein
MDMAKKAKKQSVKPRKRSARQRSRKIKKSRHRTSSPKRYDPRLEMGLKHMRDGGSLAESAKKIGITPAQLRGYAVSSGIVERRAGKWHFKRDRRFRRMPLYVDGQRLIITVHNSKTASQIGAYMRAVRQFFETEDIRLLAPFQDQSVPDVHGKRYVFETRPNVLFRLDASGIEPFEIAYEIVKRE